MPRHTVANVGPTAIDIVRPDGLGVHLQPGEIVTCEIKEIHHQPNGRVEYTVRDALDE